MNFKLVRLILMGIKYSFYGTLLQAFLMVNLMAFEGNAQYKSVKETDVKIEINNSWMEEVFRQIEDQTSYTFFYDKSKLNGRAIKGRKSGVYKVSEILLKISKEAKVQFRQVNNNIAVSPLEDDQSKQEVIEIIIEDIQIQGKVTDQNGEPLPGASVVVKGSPTIGTVTDIDGNYRITTSEDATLLVSYVGYESTEISISGRSTIDVTLVEDLETLAEVVVVGYGTVEKKDLTGSVASVDAQDISQIEAQTIDQALIGKMPGVYVTAQNGGPGEGALINIRGMSALSGDNQPLYVIDGVPVVVKPIYSGNGTVAQNQMVDAQPNPLLSINPNDIERVDVLKDASSAAIYGSRAANGVIMITTKKGRRNQAPRFDFTYKGTVQNVINTADVLNAEEYKAFHTEQAQGTLDNTTLPEFLWPVYYPNELMIINNPDDFFGDADTNWQNEVLQENALWHQYNFTMSGGSESLNYMVSPTISDQDGVMIGTNLKRYGINTSVDADITDWFRMGTSINYNHSINKRSGIENLTTAAYYRPDLPVYNEDGTPTEQPNLGRNPVAGEGEIRDETISTYLIGNVYAEFKIIEGLRFRSQLSLVTSDGRTKRFVPGFTREGLSESSNGFPVGDHSARLSTNVGLNTTFTNTLTYAKTFDGGHSINVVGGVSWDRARTEIQGTRYYGYPDAYILTDLNSAQDQYLKTSSVNQNALNSVFTRINYNYEDRFLATFTGRYDGSIKFGPENRYGFFPSGAIAWNMHNEGFLQNNSLISQMKVRASYGITGNDNLAAFSFVPLYTSFNGNGTTVYNDISGIAVKGVPNPGIKWEETQQLDVGIEYGLFNGRLNGEVVYFEKNTYDIILLTPIAAQNGGRSYSSNVADLSNKGWEITIGGDVIRNADLRWNSSFNISTTVNKIERLNGGTLYNNGTFLFEGMSPGVIRGYEVVNIAQTQEEIDQLNTVAPEGIYQSSLLAPGDYIYRDINGDGTINDDDIVELGNINPDFFGGWNNTISYKNFDLSFNFQFSKGNDKIFGPVAGNGGMDYANPTQNKERFVLDTWTPERTDATYARFRSGTHGHPFYGNNDKSVLDASYIRLRAAGISYNIPQAWLDGTSIARAKITLSGNNLFTITNYPGLDPEGVNQQRAGSLFDRQYDSNSAYPVTRMYTLSVNIGF